MSPARNTDGLVIITVDSAMATDQESDSRFFTSSMQDQRSLTTTLLYFLAALLI